MPIQSIDKQFLSIRKRLRAARRMINNESARRRYGFKRPLPEWHIVALNDAEDLLAESQRLNIRDKNGYYY
jgi:hypothetical protein